MYLLKEKKMSKIVRFAVPELDVYDFRPSQMKDYTISQFYSDMEYLPCEIPGVLKPRLKSVPKFNLFLRRQPLYIPLNVSNEDYDIILSKGCKKSNYFTSFTLENAISIKLSSHFRDPSINQTRILWEDGCVEEINLSKEDYSTRKTFINNIAIIIYDDVIEVAMHQELISKMYETVKIVRTKKSYIPTIEETFTINSDKSYSINTILAPNYWHINRIYTAQIGTMRYNQIVNTGLKAIKPHGYIVRYYKNSDDELIEFWIVIDGFEDKDFAGVKLKFYCINGVWNAPIIPKRVKDFCERIRRAGSILMKTFPHISKEDFDLI